MPTSPPRLLEIPWPVENSRVAVTVDFYDGAMSGILTSVEEPGELGFCVVGVRDVANAGQERVARAWPLALGTADRFGMLPASLPHAAARLAIAGSADAEVQSGRAVFPLRSKFVVEFGPRGELVRVWKSPRPLTDADVTDAFGLRPARELWEFLDSP